MQPYIVVPVFVCVRVYVSVHVYPLYCRFPLSAWPLCCGVLHYILKFVSVALGWFHLLVKEDIDYWTFRVIVSLPSFLPYHCACTLVNQVSSKPGSQLRWMPSSSAPSSFRRPIVRGFTASSDWSTRPAPTDNWFSLRPRATGRCYWSTSPPLFWSRRRTISHLCTYLVCIRVTLAQTAAVVVGAEVGVVGAWPSQRRRRSH